MSSTKNVHGSNLQTDSLTLRSLNHIIKVQKSLYSVFFFLCFFLLSFSFSFSYFLCSVFCSSAFIFHVIHGHVCVVCYACKYTRVAFIHWSNSISVRQKFTLEQFLKKNKIFAMSEGKEKKHTHSWMPTCRKKASKRLRARKLKNQAKSKRRQHRWTKVNQIKSWAVKWNIKGNNIK